MHLCSLASMRSCRDDAVFDDSLVELFPLYWEMTPRAFDFVFVGHIIPGQPVREPTVQGKAGLSAAMILCNISAYLQSVRPRGIMNYSDDSRRIIMQVDRPIKWTLRHKQAAQYASSLCHQGKPCSKWLVWCVQWPQREHLMGLMPTLLKLSLQRDWQGRQDS